MSRKTVCSLMSGRPDLSFVGTHEVITPVEGPSVRSCFIMRTWSSRSAAVVVRKYETGSEAVHTSSSCADTGAGPRIMQLAPGGPGAPGGTAAHDAGAICSDGGWAIAASVTLAGAR